MSNAVSAGTNKPDARRGFQSAVAEKRQLFLFHVPKTGGRTIIKSVQRKHGSENVLVPRKKKTLLADIFYERKYHPPLSEPEQQLDDVHICGHFASLSCIAGREDQFHKACFWRHPADWYLSYYNWRHVQDKQRQKRSYKFSDFTKSFARNPMTQEFLLYCADMPGWKYFLLSDRGKFEAALRVVRRFDLFADIAQVDAYLISIGIAEEGKIEYVHRYSKTVKVLGSLDENVRRRFQRQNPVDFYLHRIALGRDVAQVVADARANLRTTFSFGAMMRLLMRPYYRLKIKVLPFI
jgi:hypothetical protein